MSDKTKKGEPVETGVYPDDPTHLYAPVFPSSAPQPDHFAGNQRTDAEWVDPHFVANQEAEAAVAAGKEPAWETSDPAPTPGTKFGGNVPEPKKASKSGTNQPTEGTTAPAEGK